MPQTVEQVRKLIADNQEVILEVSAATATAICTLAERARTRGEDKSFEYWFEEAACNGKVAFIRSWDYSETSKNQREFNKFVQEAKIKFVAGSPASAEDRVKYAEICVRYKMFDVTQDDVKQLREAMAKELQAKLAAETAAKQNGHKEVAAVK